MAEGKQTWLEREDYRKMLRAMPVVSVDLVIYDEAGRILLGRRNNRPAADSWFVPGGRLLKGEDIASAVRRISMQELGIEMDHERVLGVYHQRYPDNFADDSFDSHYVTFPVSVVAAGSTKLCSDDQHEELRWWVLEDLMKAHDVHKVVKNYFLGDATEDRILPA